MKKMNWNFLNRIEKALFGKENADYQPATGETFMIAMVGGIICALATFGMEMFGAERDTVSIVISLGAIAIIGLVVKRTLSVFRALGTPLAMVAYGAYLFFLTGLAFVAGVWLVYLVLILVVLYIVLMAVGGSSGNGKKKYKVTFGDGSSRDVEKSGQGICGEEYFKDSDGNEYIKH